ncbi:thiol:disulfide interchange protein DsbG [Marinimicrobium sp. C2-29]|uniref:thiol:disulfide interchange protein DsbG n=1 Tax=Marinimicrobium sp. C2-29 TaxID=3139825 RepID=UPI003138F9B4
MTKNLTLSVLATALLAASACSDESSTSRVQDEDGSGAGQRLAAPLKQLELDGVNIGESFPGPGGLTGYIGRYNGQPVEMYLTQDGQHVVVGTLINNKGERVAQDRLNSASSSGIEWEDLEATHWIAEGDADAEVVVYAFMDPNCPYCAMFWEQAQPYLERGGVQLRHIMVGMLRPDSLPKAATILAADDPAEALAQHQRTVKDGGVTPEQDLPEEVLGQVEENTQFMRTNGIQATPAVLFKDSEGRLQTVQGVPSEQVMSQHIFRN